MVVWIIAPSTLHWLSQILKMHHKITSNVLHLISQLRQKNSYHHTITRPFQVLIRNEKASKYMRDLNFGNYHHNIKQLMSFTGFIKNCIASKYMRDLNFGNYNNNITWLLQVLSRNEIASKNMRDLNLGNYNHNITQLMSFTGFNNKWISLQKYARPQFWWTGGRGRLCRPRWTRSCGFRRYEPLDRSSVHWGRSGPAKNKLRNTVKLSYNPLGYKPLRYNQLGYFQLWY